MKTHAKKGMVLAECLTSITILTVCIVILSGVITSSATSTSMSRDYIIAQNLANEAKSIVEIIRNSNWMIRPTEKASCWLVKDPSQIIAATTYCSSYKVNTTNFYLPYFNILTGAWSLQQTLTTDLDLNSNQDSINSKYILKLTDIGKGTTMYLQNQATGTATKFYRRIKFTEIDEAAGLAKFEVKVEWKDGAKVRKYVIPGTIKNYP